MRFGAKGLATPIEPPEEGVASSGEGGDASLLFFWSLYLVKALLDELLS